MKSGAEWRAASTFVVGTGCLDPGRGEETMKFEHKEMGSKVEIQITVRTRARGGKIIGSSVTETVSALDVQAPKATRTALAKSLATQVRADLLGEGMTVRATTDAGE
jgi:hypothetical protein